MTDPIKEQAEKEARAIMNISTAPITLTSQIDQAKEHDKFQRIARTIETHLRDKAEIEKARKRACNDAAILASENDTLENRIKALEAEVERLRERSDLFQTIMTNYNKQLTQERQLADELAETLNYVAKYIKPNQDGYYYTTTALSKHKKRRGEA